MQPKKINLIRWSAVKNYSELVSAISKRLFPMISESDVIKINNLNHLELTPEEFSKIIYHATKVTYEVTYKKSSDEKSSEKSSSEKKIVYFLKSKNQNLWQNKNSVLEIKIIDFSDKSYKKNISKILEEIELYHDSKSLKKLIRKKPHEKILFNLYQTATNKIVAEIIPLQ